MTRGHTLDQAAEFARTALARMAEQKVPATPENFMLWYEFAAGSNAELSKALDVLLTNKREFTPTLNQELYEQFYGIRHRDDSLRQASSSLHDTIREVQTLIGDAGADVKDYGRALVNISGEVNQGGGSPERLQGVVRKLLIETQAAIERNNVLETRLETSAEQIEQLRHNLDNLQREANTDPLTGIANRKAFDEILLRSASLAMETGGELSLLLADIDHFKRFNDTYGHQFGDQVLKLVARCLRDGTKERDLAARYGGEEFAVLLPGCKLADAVRVADRLRNTIATRRLVRRSTGEEVGAVTISMGVAGFEYGEPVVEFVARADKALYAAKRAGRNCVQSQDDLPAGAD